MSKLTALCLASVLFPPTIVTAAPAAVVENSPRYTITLPTVTGTDSEVQYFYVFDFGADGQLSSLIYAGLSGLEKTYTRRTKTNNTTVYENCKGYTRNEFISLTVCDNPGTITTYVCEYPIYDGSCNELGEDCEIQAEGENWERGNYGGIQSNPNLIVTTLTPHANATIEIGRASAWSAFTYANCDPDVHASGSSSGVFLRINVTLTAANQSAVTAAVNAALADITLPGVRGQAGKGTDYALGDVVVESPRWSFSSGLFTVDLLNYGTSSASATIYGSTNGTSWTSVATQTLPASWLVGSSPTQTRLPSKTTWTDSGSSGFSRRFYRVKVGGSCIGDAFGYVKHAVDGTYSYFNNPFVGSVRLATTHPGTGYSGLITLGAYRDGYQWAELEGGSPLWAGDFDWLKGGEGFLVSATSNTTLYFAGYIADGASSGVQALEQTYSLVGSYGLSDYTLNTSGLPAANGDKVHKWNKGTQSYQTSTYTTSWSSNFSLSFGEGFLYEPVSEKGWGSGTSITCP